MGIFHELVQVYNRAPEPLRVTFDGQQTVLEPGLNSLPKVAVEYAKRQNVIMGTADPDNPSMSGAQYLVGVVGKDDCEPLSAADYAAHLNKPCRLDLEILADDRLQAGESFQTRTKGRRTQAKGRSDMGVHVSAPVLEQDA